MICNGSGKKSEKEEESARHFDGNGGCMVEIESASDDEGDWFIGEPIEGGMYVIMATIMITRSFGLLH